MTVPAVDETRRLLGGWIVTFARPMRTSGGMLTFDEQSCRFPADLSRVKLLREHDQGGDVLGHLVRATTYPGVGVYGVFDVVPGPLGDAAIATAARRDRDGLSVGIELDETERLKAWTSRTPITARGVVREVSQCAVPANDDCRIQPEPQ